MASMVRRQAAIRANQRREVTVVKSIFAPRHPRTHREPVCKVRRVGISEEGRKEAEGKEGWTPAVKDDGVEEEERTPREQARARARGVGWRDYVVRGVGNRW